MKKLPWFALSLIIILLDQITKYWALVSLADGSLAIISGLDFTLAFNNGAAFSFLSSMGGWQRWFFSLFSLVMSIVFIIWLLRISEKDKWLSLALSLILGGAVGNLYDRLFYGQVIDFIHVYYKQLHWPIFNLADSAICIGAFFLLIDMLKSKSKAQVT